MKQMPAKQFHKLTQRLRAAGFSILRPYSRRRWGNTLPYNWYIRPDSSISRQITCRNQAHVIQWARHILDGGPRPTRLRG